MRRNTICSASRLLLGPILFNIFLRDRLLIIKETDFDSYTDDSF